MESLNRFIEHRAKLVLDQYVSLPDTKPYPVELYAVGRLCGVESFEEREMVPEAVMTTLTEGFKIYLQSNFADLPGMRTRRRFSLAHEIAHTFFFEVRDGALRLVAKAPIGDQLEQACHMGARLLLVPERFLKHELDLDGDSITAEQIVRLSALFDVSVEVMLRRLQDLAVFERADVAPILVHRGAIEFAVYPPWLKAVLPTPKRGLQFTSWFNRRKSAQNIVHEERSLESLTSMGLLRARCVEITHSLCIFELKIEPPLPGSEGDAQ
jgi:hypothetical protein